MSFEKHLKCAGMRPPEPNQGSLTMQSAHCGVSGKIWMAGVFPAIRLEMCDGMVDSRRIPWSHFRVRSPYRRRGHGAWYPPPGRVWPK